MQGIKHKLRGENHTQRIANPCITVTKPQKRTSLFSSILRTWSDMFKEEKVEKSEAPSSADSNASKIDEFEDRYKEIWQKH
jgi:hypothetical protein